MNVETGGKAENAFHHLPIPALDVPIPMRGKARQ
jgi:hypothetical protein